jgi:hypothetical protein
VPFGVVGQGYTLEMSGENKWLKLLSWSAHDKRSFKELHFEPEPNVWYTLKCGRPWPAAKPCWASLEARRRRACRLDQAVRPGARAEPGWW